MEKKTIKPKKNITFTRQDSHKKKRLNIGWRKPKGLQSKMRLSHKGHKATVKPGYGINHTLKNLHPSGLIPKTVANLSDLDSLSKDKDGAILSSTLGLRKKITIIGECIAKSIKILNLKDPDAFLNKIKESEIKKKEKKAVGKKEKDEKKEELKKIAEKKKKKSIETAVDKSEQEKADEEKKEKDKVLITKE